MNRDRYSYVRDDAERYADAFVGFRTWACLVIILAALAVGFFHLDSCILHKLADTAHALGVGK